MIYASEIQPHVYSQLPYMADYIHVPELSLAQRMIILNIAGYGIVHAVRIPEYSRLR